MTVALSARTVWGLTASVAAAISYLYLGTLNSNRNDIVDSPLTWIRSLTRAEQDSLPYPPDALPGARDVKSSYGSIRVYEWGPEEGRRVLFIHGISTPGIALASIAEQLANSGCRVMVFDLFGRGYSSTPDPAVYPQNIQLFTTQILLVLASSPVSWIGPNSFTIVGYSLGGGIAAAFTSQFPNLVDALVLLAPSGLVRPSRIHWTSKFIYGGILPSSLIAWLVWRRLGGNSKVSRDVGQRFKKADVARQVEVAAISEEEPAPHPALSYDSTAILCPSRPSISVADVVAWQLHNNAGFLPAFISSIQHAPISDQHEDWRRIGSRLKKQRSAAGAGPVSHGSRIGKVLLILGKTDDIVLAEEVGEDAKLALGEDSVDVRVLDGGHDLPITNAEMVTESVLDFWATHSPQTSEN